MVLLFLIGFLLWPQLVFAQVVISELNWSGSEYSSSDEWIELTSVSEDRTDLAGWTLTRQKSGQQVLVVTFEEGDLLHPDETRVLSRLSSDKSTLASDSWNVVKDLILPNTHQKIRLYNASGALIDGVDDGHGAPFAGRSSPTKASMERIDLTSSGTDPQNWRTSTVSTGFKDGIEQYGSPATIPVDEEPEKLEIVISEVLSNPKGSDDNEWIELVSTADEPQSIYGMELRVGSYSFTLDREILLDPGQYVVFRRSQTKISLPNTGSRVELLLQGRVLDTFEYPETAEEVSFGRVGPDTTALCVPTPGKRNNSEVFRPRIGVQSGFVRKEAPLSINIEALVDNGSLAHVDCEWSTGDGQRSESCNPPTFHYDTPGDYTLTLQTRSYCGDTHTDRLRIQVLEPKTETVSEVDVANEIPVALEEIDEAHEISECVSSVLTGVLISEVFPSPAEGPEWIELYNTHDIEVQLCGWSIDDRVDGGSKPISLDSVRIPPQSYRVLTPEFTPQLNNTGDSVELLQLVNTVDRMQYSSTKYDISYSRIGETWCRSRVSTPGKENTCVSEILNKKSVHKSEKTATNRAKTKYKNRVNSGIYLNISSQVGRESSISLNSDTAFPLSEVLLSSGGIVSLVIYRGRRIFS